MAPSLQDAQISFVGGGNMASAIIGGLLAKDIAKQHIYVAEPWDVNRDKMAALGVRTTADNVEASRDADIVIIAVKPQVAKVACTELGAAWATRERLPLVISIAAGITVASYVEWFSQGSGRTPPIVRVMPNTPALVGEGASGLFANEGVSADEKDLATALLASVSRAAEWVDKESLLDVVTGISGKSCKSTTFTSSNSTLRLWPRLLLRLCRAPHHRRNQPGSLRRAGHSPGQADCPRRWKDAGRGHRRSRPAEEERHQPQRHHPRRAGELRERWSQGYRWPRRESRHRPRRRAWQGVEHVQRVNGPKIDKMNKTPAYSRIALKWLFD